MNSNKHLPRILCLHGSGVSAAIFSVQTRAIQHFLRYHFRFVFIDAPFESEPGPGILPAFEGAGPFYRWASGLKAVPGGEDSESERVRAEMRAEEETARKTVERALSVVDGAPFVGIMGFSQGARVATGVLLRQQNGRSIGRSSAVPMLQFGIMLCGTYPPIGVGTIPAREKETTRGEQKLQKICIPTIHAHGLRDGFLPQSKKLLARHFHPSSVCCLQFDGGHHVVKSEQDIRRLVDAILYASE